MKLFFYTLRDFDELACAKAFSKEFGIDFDYTSAYPDAENYKLAAGADGVCMTPCDMGGAMLERFASVGVRWILCRSIGYDHVDLDKAKALGLRVSNVSYPPSGVANYAIMLMLMLQRRIMSILRRADLQDYSLRGKIGDDISFSTVGVIGTGRIGRTVIEHLAGFGCRILCYDPYENAAVREHASYVSLEELYAQSDIITLHTNATEENYHLLNDDAFTRMNMQDEILKIWQRHKMTMLMVTHDVDEAIHMSDRVVVMTSRPSRVNQIIDIHLPRPRVRGQEDFFLYRKKILEILNFAGQSAEPDFYI